MVVMGFVLNKPKPLSALYSGWQEMLAEHRQLVVEVQEIAEETGGESTGLHTPVVVKPQLR